MSTKTALITGATSGFGEAIAIQYARNGMRLIITGRRQTRLDKLAQLLKNEFNTEVLPLCFDVRNREEVENSLGNLPEEWQPIDILVNNAGLASGLDTIDQGDPDDWDKMIDTNVKGLLYVTHTALPYLKKAPHSHIINIGSTAGKEVYLKGNVYCASKHAVDALTKAMRIDLLPHGIKVTGICPGAAETEFSLVRFKGDADKAKAAYSGYQPMTAEDIASIAYYVTTLPHHLCINDLVVTSLAQANSFYIHRE